MRAAILAAVLFAPAFSAAAETQATDYGINGGAETVTVPFDLINNHIYVSALINGALPMRLIVDTGGSLILTKSAAARAKSANGAGRSEPGGGTLRLAEVRIGGAYLRNQRVAVLGLDRFFQSVEGVNADGIIGFELFRRFVVHIDYATSQLTLALPGALDLEAAGTPVPFSYDHQVPTVHGAIDELQGALIIDTGNRESLTLFTPFVDGHGLRAKYAASVTGVGGYGFSGPLREQDVRVRKLRLGDKVVSNVIAGLSLAKRGAFASANGAGSVGTGVLKRFAVTFDYGHRDLYLTETGRSPVASVDDRSGLFLVRDGKEVKVLGVFTSSPAYCAGVRADDVVTAIDDASIDSLTLPSIRRLLDGPAGTPVSVSLRSNAGTRRVTFVLRDFV